MSPLDTAPLPVGEYGAEPIPGLPNMLPAGETLLWQGTPRWLAFARRTFPLRLLAGYFVLIALWCAAGVYAAGPIAMLRAGVEALLIGAIAVGLVALYGYLLARGTIVSITSRRIVVRSGIAVPTSVNLPFAKIDQIGLKLARDGTGDLLLRLGAGSGRVYFALWPHLRPLPINRVDAVLRGLPHPERAAEILTQAIAAITPAGDIATLGASRAEPDSTKPGRRLTRPATA